MDAKLYALAGTYLAEPHLQNKPQLVTIERVELREFDKGKRGGKDNKKVKHQPNARRTGITPSRTSRRN